jgi:hypothetical protein
MAALLTLVQVVPVTLTSLLATCEVHVEPSVYKDAKAVEPPVSFDRVASKYTVGAGVQTAELKR